MNASRNNVTFTRSPGSNSLRVHVLAPLILVVINVLSLVNIITHLVCENWIGEVSFLFTFLLWCLRVFTVKTTFVLIKDLLDRCLFVTALGLQFLPLDVFTIAK